MGVRDRLHQRVGDARGLVVGEGVALYLREELFERHAVDVLHDQVGVPGVVGEVDDGDNIGMLQHACGASLRQRGARGFRGGARVGGRQGHALDGDAALQAAVQADLDAAKSARGPGL